MIFGILESFNESPLLLYLGVISIACMGGGIPPILERRRRRSIENQLPTVEGKAATMSYTPAPREQVSQMSHWDLVRSRVGDIAQW